MDDLIHEAGVLHLVDNNSDHSVIFCVVSCEWIKCEEQKKVYIPSKPSWRNALTKEKDILKQI